MKNIRKHAVLGSALGLLFVAGAFAADEGVRSYGIDQTTNYFNQPADQWSADSAAPKGARGPLREERMGIEYGIDQPTEYFNHMTDKLSGDMDSSRGARGPLREDRMGIEYGIDGPTVYGN